jgi:hypothetical protein
MLICEKVWARSRTIHTGTEDSPIKQEYRFDSFFITSKATCSQPSPFPCPTQFPQTAHFLISCMLFPSRVSIEKAVSSHLWTAIPSAVGNSWEPSLLLLRVTLLAAAVFDAIFPDHKRDRGCACSFVLVRLNPPGWDVAPASSSSARRVLWVYVPSSCSLLI